MDSIKDPISRSVGFAGNEESGKKKWTIEKGKPVHHLVRSALIY